jgi:hypothetical protein
MRFVFNYDPSVARAPAGFLSGLAAAASYLDSLITNPIVVTVNVGWGEIAGRAMPTGDVASALPSSLGWLPYSTVTSELAAAADASSVANLPVVDPYPGADLSVPAAEEKAWGLIPADGTEIDGSIGFSSVRAFSFDPANRAVPNEIDFIGAAEHELTHVLGRYSSPGLYTPLDLFRYTGPGVHPLSIEQPNYLSIDDGATSLDPFDVSSDPADWASSVQGDSFGGYARAGIEEQVTPTDIAVMDVLGFDVAPAAPNLSRSGTYAFAAPGDGTAVYLSGTGQVTLSGGGDTVDVMGGADTIFAAPGAPANTIQNDGSVFFHAADAASQTVDLLTGAGAATLVGAANTVLIDQDAGVGTGAMMVAAAGNETLFGAASSANDQYWGSFQDGGDLMFAGSGTDILVGGDGADTMVGGGGTDVFYVISAKVIGAMTNTTVTPGTGRDRQCPRGRHSCPDRLRYALWRRRVGCRRQGGLRRAGERRQHRRARGRHQDQLRRRDRRAADRLLLTGYFN